MSTTVFHSNIPGLAEFFLVEETIVTRLGNMVSNIRSFVYSTQGLVFGEFQTD